MNSNDKSPEKPTGISRRSFIAGATSGISAAGLATSTVATSAVVAGEIESGEPLRAVVLEFADRWTKGSLGLAQLLESVGMEVEVLDPSLSPLKQPSEPHLLAIGSFVNGDATYKNYVKEYAQALQGFVHRGGVLLEMTQSDQYGNTVSYLPSSMQATRGDRDLSAVYPIAAGHPLVANWFPAGAKQVGADYFHRRTPNWESFESWQGMGVLLASEANAGSPCMLEGAHGSGRFLLSSLWLDKCFQEDGSPTYGDAAAEVSRAFFASVAGYVQLVAAGAAPPVEVTQPPVPQPTGPMIGHVDSNTARVWFRPSETHHSIREWRCILESDGKQVGSSTGRLDADHDFTTIFDFSGLVAGTSYAYTISPANESSPQPLRYGPHKLVAGPANDVRGKTVLGLGSCAPSDPNDVWDRIVQEGCEGFVFLGDTPYVDSSDLHTAREKHRNFLSQPEIANMIACMPCWGTWDDHDFGLNDGHGDFPGKHVCRMAFTEYRANREYGHDSAGNLQRERFAAGRGIYTSFRRGPLELFLIDPRWFSRTEPSWADPNLPTCIGKKQWEWLQAGLKASDAPFKALTTGMIWDDKQNSERDDWHTYRHERDAIFDFIRDERISGCFLISGDIHVSRALNYGPRVGYDLWQFIVSPLHHKVIPSLNTPHPNLVYNAVEPHVFLKLEVDNRESHAQLTAEWINREGRRIFSVDLDSSRMIAGD